MTVDFFYPHFYLKVQCDIVNLSELKKLKSKLLKENDSYKNAYVLTYLDDIEMFEAKA